MKLMLLQIILFQLVSVPGITAAVMKMLLGHEIWWVTLASLLIYMTNTSLDAIDTLYIVKPYRRAFIQMFKYK